ncbi:hypothetical protein C7410_12276 [Paraburkholderia silvatlantica]|uniref:Thymidylate synthase n=1 Tax=Paraburkholderia silvatlantica TaxID=321895 RepID=A0A2V4T8U6_9BURK|nr:thymidylate synthase [Paraburkholderia silvatlantica]PYE18374.1 hypothetical protein C7410_12276 [Paraburkholderia silvatlantica]
MTKRHTPVVAPFLVDEPDLSRAWAKAVLHVIDHGGTEVSPLVLSVTGFDEDGMPAEDTDVRSELDKLLLLKKYRDVADVAFTIFPQRLWQIARGDRNVLFKLYRDAFPRYQAMNRRDNRRGLYFERLTGFGSGPCDGNQLEWILSQYSTRQGVRRSMFQASVFDPARDHVEDIYLQFPCMQHVSFEPTSEGLVINAFYATQQLFVKAYGNYLGIAQLGAFMANQMDMKLIRMNVVVGVAKLEKISKSDPAMRPLLAAARACLMEQELAVSRQPAEKTTSETTA